MSIHTKVSEIRVLNLIFLGVSAERHKDSEGMTIQEHSAFVNPPRKPKHYKTSTSDDQNSEKIGTVLIITDIKGRDKKENTAKQKKQPSPIATLSLPEKQLRR